MLECLAALINFEDGHIIVTSCQYVELHENEECHINVFHLTDCKVVFQVKFETQTFLVTNDMRSKSTSKTLKVGKVNCP